MRESLTVLAGLLVLALLAALIGPGFVDWRDYRPQIETRLSAALGVETSVAGGIGLRLLPSPRLTLNDVRVGGMSTEASTVAVEQLTVELALSALARGEFRFADAQAEGATVSVVLDDAGAIRLPTRTGSGLPAQTSLDRLTIRRSALIWRDRDKEPVMLSPIAAEVSAISLAGPWRIEGEVAGSSLRITTGELEEGGRLRAKAFVTGEDAQIAFDGAFLLPASQTTVGIGVEGSFTLAPGGALGLTGMVRGGSRQLDLSGLVLDIAGGAARLEGEGQFLPASGSGSLALRARRLDADGLIAALGERAGFERALQALPGTFDIGLDLDQLIWRGEDFSALALRGRLHGNGLSDASASVRVAGALIGASGGADSNGIAGQINIKAEDSRRVGLVLARAGLDPALADLIAGLGRIDAEAVAAWDGGRVGVQRLLVTGSSGIRLEGSGDIMSDWLVAKATLHGLDLNTLPPATSFAGLVGQRDLALDIALTNARFRNAPPGSANLDLRREGTTWRLSRLAIDGFGGVAVTGAGALLAEGGEISGRIRAPRFETLAALAGPLLPDLARQALARAGDGLSRLDAGFRLTRSSTGDTGVSVEGGAQAGRLSFDGRLDPAGTWNNASLRFDLADRRQAFAALGLPAPMQGGAGKLVLERAAGRLLGSLAGAGLSVVLEDEASGGSRLTVQADGPSQVLPEGPARLLPDGILDAHAKVGFAAEAVTLDNLVVNLDGATVRGSLVLPREGAYSGKLVLPAVDLRALLAASLGGTPAGPGATWSTARFGRTAGLPDLALAIEAGTLTAADSVVMRDARLTLQADQDGLRFENLTAAYGGGQVRGRLGIRREGGLAQLSGRVNLTQVDLAGLTNGALSGKLSGQLEAGGSGESPARLIAGLGGAGSVTLTGARLSRFDPAAYSRVIAATGEDASESDTSRLQGRLGEALDRDAWALGDVTLPFTLAAGLARLQPFSFERSGLRAEASGVVDLRALTADIRLGLKPLGPLPKGWPGDAPQIGVAWRGPLSAPRRETDVSALSNTVAARALAREIERVEAFEADARERAMHSRRLRAEREMRENERKLAEFLKAEEDRRIAEEKRAEEASRAEELRRLAEEKRAEDAKRAEQARLEQEMRRRIEAEDRAARARAAAERAAAQQPQPGPLILPGAPRSSFPDSGLQPVTPGAAVPPLAPPLQIESVPRPLSRSVPPN
ncbi:AsmA family protein [Bosea lathyri]|uniref:Uncharacterized protein involved in outer membrane biogenesis n=1 Tax=Bosea lathyri TaxID=1036778 RepID=A0A1H5XA76_9HYPH|nr:AsmA family protein [Bosea lathyri]SEG08639.1 Uncharacterized protein involved in outer membrane biogenesis [Bosea lathyri]